MIDSYDVVCDLERRLRIERPMPPDWSGIDPNSDMALLVRVLVDHINRAMGEQRDRTVLGIP